MEQFLDNVKDLNNVIEKITQIKKCSSIIIDEIKPEYKSLHCGQYKNYPLVIKDGPHGFYLDYKKEKISLKSIDTIHEWVKDQEMNEERMKILIDYMNHNKSMIINDSISIRKNKEKDQYYLFHKTSKMKKPKFYSFPNEYMNENDYIDKIKEYIEKKYKLI